MSTRPQFENSDKLTPEQVASVRCALQSVLSSSAFAGSKGCQVFLRLAVERSLAGDVELLPEPVIGVEMFGAPADYDTSNDAVVRVRATEVRKRLAQYYTEAKQTPQVRIELPRGSYVPEFHWSSRTVAEDGSAAAARPLVLRWRSRPVVAIVAVIAIVSLSLFLLLRRKLPPQRNPVRLSLGLPQGVTLQRNWHPFEQMAVSPDGEMLAFSATDASGQSSLWIRPLSSAEARRVDQTEGALLPFWSPDSHFIGFWAGGKLKKIPRTGGLPEVICGVPEIAQGAWGADGTILFAKAVNSPIFRVAQDGASATPATSLLPGQVSQMWVQFLPDGKRFIYLARTSLTTDDPQAKVYVQSLNGGAPIELLTSQSRAIAVPEYVLFAQGQNLLAQRMDWKALRKIGEPSLLARDVAASPAYLGTSEFTASQNGVLIYGTAEGSSFDHLKWYARDGSTSDALEPVIYCA